jgi:glucokinase
MANSNSILAGDIGGTHARFAIVDRSDSAHWRLHDWLDLSDGFASFAETLRHTSTASSGAAFQKSSRWRLPDLSLAAG